MPCYKNDTVMQAFSTNQKENQNQSWLGHTRFPMLNMPASVLALSFDWCTGLSVSFVIGQSGYFGLGLITLNGKSIYHIHGMPQLK